MMPSSRDPLTLLTRISSWRRLLFSRDTPWRVRGILLLALLYLLSPLDLIPDWIAGLGLLDDLTIVSILVAWAIKIASRNPKK